MRSKKCTSLLIKPTKYVLSNGIVRFKVWLTQRFLFSFFFVGVSCLSTETLDVISSSSEDRQYLHIFLLCYADPLWVCTLFLKVRCVPKCANSHSVLESALCIDHTHQRWHCWFTCGETCRWCFCPCGILGLCHLITKGNSEMTRRKFDYKRAVEMKEGSQVVVRILMCVCPVCAFVQKCLFFLLLLFSLAVPCSFSLLSFWFCFIDRDVRQYGKPLCYLIFFCLHFFINYQKPYQQISMVPPES